MPLLMPQAPLGTTHNANVDSCRKIAEKPNGKPRAQFRLALFLLVFYPNTNPKHPQSSIEPVLVLVLVLVAVVVCM